MVDCQSIRKLFNFDDQCERNQRFQFSASNLQSYSFIDEGECIKIEGQIVLLSEKKECSLECLSIFIKQKNVNNK